MHIIWVPSLQPLESLKMFAVKSLVWIRFMGNFIIVTSREDKKVFIFREKLFT